MKAGKERLNFSVYRQCVQNFVAFSEYMNFDTVKIKFIYSEKAKHLEKIPKCYSTLLSNIKKVARFSNLCGLLGIIEL